MNRRNFFKLAAGLALARLLPAKLHSGGIVSERVMTARSKFNNLQSFNGFPCIYFSGQCNGGKIGEWIKNNPEQFKTVILKYHKA